MDKKFGGIMMPRVIQVIESYDLRGRGIEKDPSRRIRQYHTLEGEFLAEEFDDVKYEERL